LILVRSMTEVCFKVVESDYICVLAALGAFNQLDLKMVHVGVMFSHRKM